MKLSPVKTVMMCSIVSLMACQTQAAPQATTIVYSTVGDCKETIKNDNAAFSELHCKPVGAYQVDIKQQSPQYFTVTVGANGKSASSELETITKELPMEPGKVIEWHLSGTELKYMIFRIKTQTDGGSTKEFLTVNLITEKRICPIASIDVSKNSNANQKARDLLTEKFSAIKECPADVIQF
jgi:hypothetical protein